MLYVVKPLVDTAPFIHSLKHALSAWGLWARLCAKSAWSLAQPLSRRASNYSALRRCSSGGEGSALEELGGFLGDGPFELDLEDEVVLEVSSKGNLKEVSVARMQCKRKSTLWFLELGKPKSTGAVQGGTRNASVGTQWLRLFGCHYNCSL